MGRRDKWDGPTHNAGHLHDVAGSCVLSLELLLLVPHVMV